ncbi:MAG: hypothetical protein LBQ00_08735 [Syntrophobacterales bacterium]|jgi:hypothetical protein|nr:hypothetical protein [Syntrophobacterales bacterium]
MIRTLRYFYRNVNLLNIMILVAIAAILLFAIMPLFRMQMKFTLPVVKPKAVEEPHAAQEEEEPSPLDYMVIGENNLFHPERRIPVDKKDEKQLPKPELVLYGTIIHGDASVAYIEDKKSPRTTPGRGERQQVAKKGDVFNGFILKGIETDRIVLARGEETMVVHLSDETKRRSGDVGKGAPRPPAGAAVPSRTPASAITTPTAAAAGPGNIQHAPPGQPFTRGPRGEVIPPKP